MYQNITCPNFEMREVLEVDGPATANPPFSIILSVNLSFSLARVRIISSTVFLPIKRIIFTGLNRQ